MLRARLSPSRSSSLAPALAVAGALAFALGACGGSKDTAAVGLGHSTAAPHRPLKRPAAHTQRLFVAGASERLVGPFIARGDHEHLVTWIDSGSEGTRRLRALAVDDGGVPVQDTRDLVAAAGDVTSLVAKRTGGEGASFVLAWTTLGSRGEALTVMGVGDDAAPRTGPVEIAHTSDDIVWVDVVPVARGALLLWAEETRDGKANVLSVALDARGAARSLPSYVARGVVGWRAAPTSDGAALGLLSDVARKKDATGYALSLVRLDDSGRPVGAQAGQPVVPDAVVQPDFDMARVGARGVLFAWTDKSGLESEVKTAFVDDRDRATAPRGLASSLAGAKLLSLTALANGALLAWEEPTQRPRAERRVHLERVAPSGESSASTVLEVEGKGAPEITAFGAGASVLGRMRVCDKNQSDAACNAAPFAPAAIALDESLLPARAERIEQGEPAEVVALAWGLSCGKTCLMLGLGAADPANKGQPVVAAPAFARATDQRVVVSPLYAPGRPRPQSLATIFRSDPISQVAVGRAGDASLVAVLTRGDGDAPRRRGPSGAAGAGKGAALYVVPVDKEGKAGEAVPISTRASAAGGAAFATAPDGSLGLAWISREDAGDRVHLTRISQAAKRLGDVLVTTRKGDVSEANVAAVDGGFVVGWIDGRDGNGEVYTAKVNGDLGRVSEHQRITNAPGDASDLTMVAHPSGVVWLAWTDPRESPREGNGDIYAATVRAKDARKALEDTRVLATAAHSRSPSLALAQSGVAIGWIEEGPIGADVEGYGSYGAMLTWLDPRGHALRDPVRLQGANPGAPVGIVLDPEHGGSRGLLVRSARAELALDAFTVEPGGRIVSSWLVSPEGPPTLDLPLALTPEAAVYAEESRGAAEYKVRRMTLAWPP